MFAVPKNVATEVFARVPDHLRKTGQVCEFNNVQFSGHQADCFLEGPSFDRAGNLYCVDIPWGRVFRVTSQGDFSTVVEYDGWPNGLKFAPDGRAFVADYRHGIMVLDVSTGRIEPWCTHYRLERFKGVNDLVFASNGDLYFTDQGQSGLHDPSGRVFRIRHGSQDPELLLGGIPSPNGLVMNLDETRLFVAVTRANAIWRLPLVGNGVSKVGVFIQMSGGHAGPDGLALDTRGQLAVAHAGMGAVWIFSEMGEPLYRVNSCAGHLTTNVAFGGPDGRHLYITESQTGTILRAEVETPGRPMYSHTPLPS
ncbi:SMP-30/gluconolactonase/LRE family protein [Hydrogenophaga sp.]|uniref:SMP-30/gluconolactonase/LRE family protein n=1 Tax=Hydrogenophaga sp. TaxID=1904254 RepID=UPI003F707D40